MASYKDTLLEFPCDFPLKIMGKAQDELAQAVLEIVTRHAPGFDGATMEMRASSGGNYLSLTCTVVATSKPQLDALVHGSDQPPARQSRFVSMLVRTLGRVDYEPTFRAMQDFTAARTAETPDELWIVEHPPVYTLGQAGKPEHLLEDVGIPLVRIDRGGQVTYHGPGQVVIYLLLDLQRTENQGARTGHRHRTGGDRLPRRPRRRGAPARRRARRLRRRCQDCRPRPQDQKRLQLPWLVAQCRYGSVTHLPRSTPAAMLGSRSRRPAISASRSPLTRPASNSLNTC